MINLSGLSVEDISDRIKTEENLRIDAIAFESQEGMFVTNAQGNNLMRKSGL